MIPAVRLLKEGKSYVQGNPWFWTTLTSGLMALASTVWAGQASEDTTLSCLKGLAALGDADAVVTGWNRENPMILVPVRPFKVRAPGPSKFYVLVAQKNGKYEARLVDLSQSATQFQLKGISGVFDHHFSEAMAKGHPGTSQWDYRPKNGILEIASNPAHEQAIEGEWPVALREALRADLGRRLSRIRTRLELLKQRNEESSVKEAEAQALLEPLDACGSRLAAEFRSRVQPACTDGRVPASEETKLPPAERAWCEYQRVMALGREFMGRTGTLAQARRPASQRLASEVPADEVTD